MLRKEMMSLENILNERTDLRNSVRIEERCATGGIFYNEVGEEVLKI